MPINLKGNLGFLTSYNLEDIYFFIGEERMSKKIEAYKAKPTMGYKLEDIIYGENKIGNYMKGPLDCMSLFFNWFNDFDVLSYLYEKTKDFNELNYMTNSDWSVKRVEEIDRLIDSFKTVQKLRANNDRSTSEHIKKLKLYKKYNFFYIDFHFFLINLFTVIMTSDDLGFKEKIYSELLEKYLPRLVQIKNL